MIKQVKRLTGKIILLTSLLLSLSLFWALFASPISPHKPLAQAQTPSETQQSIITATVLDTTAPSVPILISPENDTSVSTTRPEFVWQMSTDNDKVSYYQLFIDGELFIDDILTTDLITIRYQLRFDSVTNYYHLEISENLELGDHSWYIVAVDPSANQSQSEIWNFIIEEAIIPIEAIGEIFQEIGKRVPEPIKQTVSTLAPISTGAVILAPPAIVTFSFFSQFGGSLSFNIISKLFQALGLIPAGKDQGKVINSLTEKSIPFALVRFFKVKKKKEEEIVETVVTNHAGVYKGIELPVGKYRIVASHQDYAFPTKQKRPAYLSSQDYYKGEAFDVRSGEKTETFFIIPMDPLKKEAGYSVITKVRIFITRGLRLSDTVIFLMFVFSAVLAFTRPSKWNWLMFFLYLLMMLKRAKTWFDLPDIQGIITDAQGVPIPNVVVKLTSPDGNRVFTIVTSDEKGHYVFSDARGIFQISVAKKNWAWVPISRSMSLNQINSRKKRMTLNLKMKKIG